MARPVASPQPIATTIRVPELTAKVKGATKVKYFGIRGDLPDALLDSTVRKSKASCKSDDVLACVSVRPDVRWTNRTGRDRRLHDHRAAGDAQGDSAPAALEERRVRASRPLSPGGERWSTTWPGTRVSTSDPAEVRREAAEADGRQKCSSANKIIKKWDRAADAAQAKFDAKDALWPYPSYTAAP